jgi:hypothetical protein
MADKPGYGGSPDVAPMDPLTDGHGTNGRGVVAAAKNRVRERAQEMKSTAQEKTAEKGRELKSRIEQVAGERSARSGMRLSSVARAMRAASEELRTDGESKLAGMTDEAAGHVERAGSYLQSENPSGMIHDLEQTARRNPALFLGATFAVGLLAGRFFRSSQGTTAAFEPDPALVESVGRGEEGP